MKTSRVLYLLPEHLYLYCVWVGKKKVKIIGSSSFEKFFSLLLLLQSCLSLSLTLPLYFRTFTPPPFVCLQKLPQSFVLSVLNIYFWSVHQFSCLLPLSTPVFFTMGVHLIVAESGHVKSSFVQYFSSTNTCQNHVK